MYFALRQNLELNQKVVQWVSCYWLWRSERNSGLTSNTELSIECQVWSSYQKHFFTSYSYINIIPIHENSIVNTTTIIYKKRIKVVIYRI